MDLLQASGEATETQASFEKDSLVDPFLVEALQNSRHRLTILRMELDILRFLQNFDQLQFEFQHFPTSYLRLAAHRVAQHYGLVTMVLDNGLDGTMNKILVKKTSEIRYPTVRLSEIPTMQTENDQPENVRIAVRPRPVIGSINELKEFGVKRGSMRSMEERKEEYDKARARIFSDPGSPISCDVVNQASIDGKIKHSCPEDNDICGSSLVEREKSFLNRSVPSSRVAIFRDKEKDLTDPDYDRSYKRYVKSCPPTQNYGLGHLPKVQIPYVHYDANFPHMTHLPASQPSVNYQPSTTPLINPYNSLGSGQSLRDNTYMQWPSASMMYSHSYDQLRHAVFQAPFCQQPLSFDYSQNH